MQEKEAAQRPLLHIALCVTACKAAALACETMSERNLRLARRQALPPAIAVAVVVLLLGHHPRALVQAQPSPGYFPSATVRSMAFSEDYDNLWGPQHQTLSQDKMALTLLMDRTSGQYVVVVNSWHLAVGTILPAVMMMMSPRSVLKSKSSSSEPVNKQTLTDHHRMHRQAAVSSRSARTGTATSASPSRSSRATPPASTLPSTYVVDHCALSSIISNYY